MHIDTLNNIIDNLQRYFDVLKGLDFTRDSRKVRYIESSRALISNLSSLLDDVSGSCPERMISNLDLVLTGEKNDVFFANIIYPELEHLIYLCRNSSSVTTQGGVREGAGRKKEAPTKQIRIDADLAEQFKMLSDLYRGQSDSDKALLLEGLISVGVSFCHDKASNSPGVIDYCPDCDEDVEFEELQAVNGDRYLECKECRHQISS